MTAETVVIDEAFASQQVLAQRITDMFATIDERQWNALDTHFDVDIVYERPGYEPFRGLDRLRAFYERERVIAEGAHRLVLVVVQGEHAACHGRFVGMHRDGSLIDESFADFYTFKDGRVVHRRSFFFRPAV